MRILTVTNYYPPHFIGGYEIACKETMDFLKNRGHEIMVVTSDYQKTSRKEEGILRDMHLTDYAKSSRISKKQDEYHNYKTVLETIRHFKPDLVYFWSLRGIGLLVIKAAQQQNIPYVFEIGDFWMYGYMQKGSPLKQKIKSLLPFLGYGNTSISPAICVSEWVAREMREKYGSETTYVYPNATKIPEKKISEHTEIKFVFAGRIEEEKGLDLAIEALKRFALRHPESKFILDIYGNGDPDYIAKCKDMAEPIASSVNFKGKVTSREEIYTGASALLMPTRMREPFGLVIIEAMAHGCAVIASDDYGPAEIIDHGQNGLLFETNNINDLLSQIEKVYFDKECLKQLQENGYEHVRNHYNIQKVKSKIEVLLKEIAGVHP